VCGATGLLVIPATPLPASRPALRRPPALALRLRTLALVAPGLLSAAAGSRIVSRFKLGKKCALVFILMLVRLA
jgi:hypothetical protein